MNFKDLSTLRPDLAFIAHWVPENAHVLDVGPPSAGLTSLGHRLSSSSFSGLRG